MFRPPIPAWRFTLQNGRERRAIPMVRCGPKAQVRRLRRSRGIIYHRQPSRNSELTTQSLGQRLW